MQKGFVALLDVLGFAALVSFESGGSRLQRYLECLQTALDTPIAVDVDYVVFSDSIVLTAKGDSEESLRALIQQCSRLFGKMLENEFALRGAIAYGSYLRAEDTGRVFVAGNPIIEAYRYETIQDWVGIMLAPSVVTRVPDLAAKCRLGACSTTEELAQLKGRLDWAAYVQPWGGIPFHISGSREHDAFQGFAIVPTSGSNEPNEVHASLDIAMSALDRLKSIAPNPDAQAKYTRSSQFLYYVNNNWQTILSWLRRYEESPPS